MDIFFAVLALAFFVLFIIAAVNHDLINSWNKKTNKDYKEITKGKLLANFGSLAFIFLILFAVFTDDSSGDNSTASKTDDSKIQESEAKVICMNAFEKKAKYGGSDSSMFGTAASKVKDSKLGEVWLVSVPGTMKNGFGVDVKVTCYCKISSKRQASQRFSALNIISVNCE